VKKELSEDILCCILGSDLEEVYIKYISIYTPIYIHTHILYVWGVCMCASVHISRIVLNLESDKAFVFFTLTIAVIECINSLTSFYI